MLKKHQLAHTSYLTALNHRRKYPDCHYNLGNLVTSSNRIYYFILVNINNMAVAILLLATLSKMDRLVVKKSWRTN